MSGKQGFLVIIIFIILLAFTSLSAYSRSTSSLETMYLYDAENSGYYDIPSGNNTFSPIPVWEEQSNFTIYSSPICIDINDDNVEDIIYADGDGSVKALSGDLSLLWEFNANATAISNPAAADIDNDGNIETVFAAKNSTGAAFLYCLNNLGKEKWNFSLPALSVRSFPTIADVTSEAGLEILISSGVLDLGVSTSTSLFCISSDGTEIWEYRNTNKFYNIDTTPVAANINDNTNLEIIFGTSMNGDLTVITNNRNGVWTRHLGFAYTSATVHNISGDENPELLVPSEKTVYCYDSEGVELWNFTTGEYIVTTPFVGDLDGDSIPEIIVASDKIYCILPNGSLNCEKQLDARITSSSLIVGDIDTGNPEMIMGDVNGTLYALSYTGNGFDVKWDVTLGDSIYASPVLADFDNDGTPELALTVRRGERNILSILDLPLTPIIPEIDFSFEGSRITVHPTEAVLGQLVTIEADIRNSGNVFSSSNIVLMVDDEVIEDRYFGLAPMTTSRETFHWKAISGTHTITLRIDPSNLVTETNEGNNQVSTEIYVAEEYVDLVVTREAVSIKDIGSDHYQLYVEIWNTGNIESGNFSVDITLNDEKYNYGNLNLKKHSSTVLLKITTTDEAGKLLIEIEVDPGNAVAESNESNNWVYILEDFTSGGDDDPVLEDFVIFLLLLPIIILGSIIIYTQYSSRKNSKKLQMTLDELEHSLTMLQKGILRVPVCESEGSKEENHIETIKTGANEAPQDDRGNNQHDNNKSPDSEIHTGDSGKIDGIEKTVLREVGQVLSGKEKPLSGMTDNDTMENNDRDGVRTK